MLSLIPKISWNSTMPGQGPSPAGTALYASNVPPSAAVTVSYLVAGIRLSALDLVEVGLEGSADRGRQLNGVGCVGVDAHGVRPHGDLLAVDRRGLPLGDRPDGTGG